MTSRQEIHNHVINVMHGMFDIPLEHLNENALLFSELDIDSIDAADLFIELTSFTGKRLPPENFKNVRSIGDVVDAIQGLSAND